MGIGNLIGDFFQFWWRRKVLSTCFLQNKKLQISVIIAFSFHERPLECVLAASIQERKKQQKCTEAFVCFTRT